MYKFPLGAVLRHRKYVEEKLQKELGILKRMLGDEKTKLSDIMKSRKKFSNELQKRQHQSISVSESLLYIRFIEQLSIRIAKQEERVYEAEKNVDSKLQELLEAVKNKKVLEKLKEKGLENYRKTVMTKERNFMNEMASVRFSLRSGQKELGN